jgi:excisionase family DNA binding protein
MERDLTIGKSGSKPPAGTAGTPWLTVCEAAERARCGVKLIYREVRARRLRAARVGGRRELRLRAEWVDEWLLKASTPVEL